ncbi:MAG: ATP-binding protein [Paracoccaceae bacterium]
MKNLLPDTIATRAMILLVVGLAASHLISVVFYSTDRQSALLAAGGEHAIHWVATTGAFADTVSADEWQQVVRAANSDKRFVTITDTPVVDNSGAAGWRETALNDALARYVTAAQMDNYKIAYAPYLPGDQSGSYWREYLSAADRQLNNDLVLVSLRLNNGNWLNVATPIEIPSRFVSSRLGLSLVVMLIAVVLISAPIVRRMTAPLERLSRAAEKLGTDVQGPAIPETGPEEVRRTAQAFNIMQNRIRSFVEDRTQMLGAIAHDLGTPITRLRLRAEFVEEQDVREKMLRDLDDMQHMVASTLSFIRDGATSEPQATVDLGSLLARVCDDIKDTGANVELAEIPRWVLLDCRPIALRRAFGNLIENAVKYGSSAQVSLQLEPDKLLIFIDDQGPGIPKERQDDVFQPFRRLEDSRNRATGGTGLGLAVARTIIRAHGGDIHLTNRTGGGLRVALHLPRSSQTGAENDIRDQHPAATAGDDANTAATSAAKPAGAQKFRKFPRPDLYPVALGRVKKNQGGTVTRFPSERTTEWKTH